MMISEEHLSYLTGEAKLIQLAIDKATAQEFQPERQRSLNDAIRHARRLITMLHVMQEKDT